MQTKDSDEFSIDRETGWIQAKSSYAGKFGEEFVINVIAKDNFGEEPYFNDTAEVKVGLYNIHIIFYWKSSVTTFWVILASHKITFKLKET